MQISLSRIQLCAIGAPNADYRRLIEDYERRLRRYVRYDASEIKAEPLTAGVERAVARDTERLRIAAERVGGALICCDRGGVSLTSVAFAERLLGFPRVVVAIGGSGGLTRDFVRSSDLVVSFGAQTLPHQLARLVVVEQIYRAFRIARGEPYHY